MTQRAWADCFPESVNEEGPSLVCRPGGRPGSTQEFIPRNIKATNAATWALKGDKKMGE
jgi:hypothetical protein